MEEDTLQVQETDKLSDTEVQELAKARRQLAKESKLGVFEVSATGGIPVCCDWEEEKKEGGTYCIPSCTGGVGRD